MKPVENTAPGMLNKGITPREIAQLKVDKFNRHTPLGSKVTYLKSEVEGRQATTVLNPAYIHGDYYPMVELQGIGAALIDKVEPI